MSSGLHYVGRYQATVEQSPPRSVLLLLLQRRNPALRRRNVLTDDPWGTPCVPDNLALLHGLRRKPIQDDDQIFRCDQQVAFAALQHHYPHHFVDDSRRTRRD
jgi:hypothetical protein